MSRTRISRTLIALLCVTIVLGLVAYFHKPKPTSADANKPGQPTAQTPSAQTPPIVTGPVVSNPSTRPSAPSTRPTQIALGGTTGVLITRTPGDVVRTGTVDSPKPAERTAPANGGTPTLKTGPAAPKPADKPAETPAIKPVDKTPAAPVIPARPGTALADGKAKFDANDFLGARQVLNDALLSGSLSATDADAAKELMGKANQTLVFSARRISGDPFAGTYTVQAGDKPMKIAASNEVTWDFLARLNSISDPRKLRAGTTIKIVRGPFHAVVSKSKFTLDLYLGSPGEKGSMFVCTYKVGLGKNNSTPTGTWMVTPQSKLKNPKWWGTADEPAREAGDPLNPLGKFWIGLQGTDGEAVGKTGFGVHGTCAPDTIGKEMSHGCIRLLNDDVERIFEMLVEGKSTLIVKE